MGLSKDVTILILCVAKKSFESSGSPPVVPLADIFTTFLTRFAEFLNREFHLICEINYPIF